jgi:hypothetical protein
MQPAENAQRHCTCDILSDNREVQNEQRGSYSVAKRGT